MTFADLYFVVILGLLAVWEIGMFAAAFVEWWLDRRSDEAWRRRRGL